MMALKQQHDEYADSVMGREQLAVEGFSEVLVRSIEYQACPAGNGSDQRVRQSTVSARVRVGPLHLGVIQKWQYRGVQNCTVRCPQREFEVHSSNSS